MPKNTQFYDTPAYGESMVYDPYANGPIPLDPVTRSTLMRENLRSGVATGALVGALGGPIGSVVGAGVGALGGYLTGRSKVNRAQQQSSVEQERAHQKIMANNAAYNAAVNEHQKQVNQLQELTPQYTAPNYSGLGSLSALNNIEGQANDVQKLYNDRLTNIHSNMYTDENINSQPPAMGPPQQQAAMQYTPQPSFEADPNVLGGLPNVMQAGVTQNEQPQLDLTAPGAFISPAHALAVDEARRARQLLPSRIEKNNASIGLTKAQTGVAGARKDNIVANTGLVPTKQKQIEADIGLKRANTQKALRPPVSSGPSAANQKLEAVNKAIQDRGITDPSTVAIIQNDPGQLNNLKLWVDKKGKPLLDKKGAPMYYKLPSFGLKTKAVDAEGGFASLGAP